MKKITACVFLLVFCFSQISSAHPPSKIDVSYDKAAESLEIYIVHNVSDPKSHFIEEVTVSVNGKEFAKTALEMQESEAGLSLEYSLPGLVQGDEVVVKVRCSRIGEKSAKIVIQE